MAPARRHRIGASRRRREDDGEEEEGGSVVGAAEDDSMSDSSGLSHHEDDDDDADEEGSDLSQGEQTISSPRIEKTNGNSTATGRKNKGRSGEGKLAVPVKPQLTATVSDTEAMMNGLNIANRTGEVTEIQFEDSGKEGRNGLGRAPSAPPGDTRRDKRRDHDEYTKARNEDPSFVPTRGGFFLHDKRSTGPESNGNRAPNNKPKSRPYGLIVDGNVGR